MRQITVFAAFLISVPCLAGASEDTCDANEVWQQIVAAKGGAARISTVQSLLVKETYTWRRLLVRHQMRANTLYVLPEFKWSWFDYGVPTLGIHVNLVYPERGVMLSVSDASFKPRKDNIAKGQALQHFLVLMLFAPRTEPVPLKCTMSGWTKKVEVRYSNIPETFTFYVQGDSALPHRVEVGQTGEKDIHIHHLSGYRDVSGLQMPTRSRLEYGTLPSPRYEVEYILNPDYDQKLPERSPSLTCGPDGWRGCQ